MSIAPAGAFTGIILARIASTAPVISSTVSPRTRSAMRKPPICEGVTSPESIASKAAAASARESAAPAATLAMRGLKDSMPASRLQRASPRALKAAASSRKIAQDVAAVLARDALRMELHAIDGLGFVSDSHDETIVALGADLEINGSAFAIDDQRMVARRLERPVQAAEKPLGVVADARHFPVHRVGRPHHVAPESLADRLMAEADAEDRRRAARGAHEVEADAGFVRRAGTGRQHDQRPARRP